MQNIVPERQNSDNDSSLNTFALVLEVNPDSDGIANDKK